VNDRGRVIRRYLLAAMLSVAIAVGANAANPAASAPTGDPREVVEAFHVVLVEIMQGADELGYQGRCDRLAATMPELFDVTFMAQKSVGRYWKTASPEERAKLLETFERFMVSNYAGNFDGYDGETFEMLEATDSIHGTVLVRTRLLASDGEVVRLNYRLRPVGDQWRIVDVYLNGTVSELALRRSEYSSLIKREGFDSLIVALNKKITNLAVDAPAEQGP
jgi:phospholipid transport system substrate-binding protein